MKPGQAARKTLIFVPLDDRPPTCDFLLTLARLLGWKVRIPPRSLLGSHTTFGDADRLLDWLERNLPSGAALLSTEMLLFGGLVASRSLDIAPRPVEERAGRLATLLRRLPKSTRHAQAFTILMRVPPYCTSEQERRFSERLLAYSQEVARAEGAPQSALQRMRLRSLQRAIPAEFLERYLRARERNRQTNAAVLDWAGQGLLDYALVGMDDSRTEGFNIQDRKKLEGAVGTLRAHHKADLIPGADELAMVLLARSAMRETRQRPTLEIIYSPAGLRGRVTRYEDRTVEELLEAHRRVLELPLVARGGDIRLYVHGAAHSQQEASMQMLPPRPSQRLLQLSRDIAADLQNGRLVALADLGYANGADRALLQALIEQVELPQLAAYAAWNTAGNTVGTTLAHAVLRWLSLRHPPPRMDVQSATLAHVKFLFERFADDWLYQSVVRRTVGARLTLRRINIYDLGERHKAVEADVAARLQKLADGFFARSFAGKMVSDHRGKQWRIGPQLRLKTTLPWPRIFEVSVDADFELNRCR